MDDVVSVLIFCLRSVSTLVFHLIALFFDKASPRDRRYFLTGEGVEGRGCEAEQYTTSYGQAAWPCREGIREDGRATTVRDESAVRQHETAARDVQSLKADKVRHALMIHSALSL